MLASTHGVGFSDSAAQLMKVQVHRTQGARIHVSGITWSALRHSLARIYAAFETCGFPRPSGAITLHIGPEMQHTNTAHLDLPISLALLASIGHISNARIDGAIFFGELTLDGTICNTLTNDHLLPLLQEKSASSVHDVESQNPKALDAFMPPTACANWSQSNNNNWVYRPCDHLKSLVGSLNGTAPLPLFRSKNNWASRTKWSNHTIKEFEQIQLPADHRMAMLVAAAGSHHTLIIGSPGTGKSMMARCIHELLPPLSESDAARLRNWGQPRGEVIPVSEIPPFRSPHPQTSAAGMFGSSSRGNAIAGECTMAHSGLLALDEFPEFNRSCIESLRSPMENGSIQIGRVNQAVKLPFNALVIATANPCPCGFYQDRQRKCSCKPGEIKRYLKRITGPISSRFSLHLETTIQREIESKEPLGARPWLYSWQAACKRVSSTRTRLHSCLPEELEWEAKSSAALELHALQHRASKREIEALKSIARTHAVLIDSSKIGMESVAFACQMRIFDRSGWWENGQNATWRTFHSDATQPLAT